MSSSLYGETPLSDNTIVTSKGGFFFVDKTEAFKPTVNDILTFLDSLIKYSVFQTARSAVSNFENLCGGIDLRDDLLIKKCMQGIFDLKQSLPKIIQFGMYR